MVPRWRIFGNFFGSCISSKPCSAHLRHAFYTMSQKTSYLWFAITLMHMNGFWYFFGRNVTDKVGNQKVLYYATSNNLCFCTTWQKEKTRKSHISVTCMVLHTHNAPVRYLPAPTLSFWQWRVVQLWPGDILNCFVFLMKKHAAFKWKDAISGFLVSPGSAEALVRCGGK